MEWPVALTTAVGVMGGATLSALVAIRMAHLGHQASDKTELRAALIAYGISIDRLTLRIDQLPQSHGIDEGWLGRLLSVWKTLDWTIGQVSIATVGRGTMKAVDEVIAAANRLNLIAPESVLLAAATISELITNLEPAEAQWHREWNAARTRFTQEARDVTNG